MAGLLVNIDVPDLAAAERFYCDAFGLHAGRRFDGAVELLGSSAPVYLLQNAEGSLATASAAVRQYRRHWTPVHLDFVVDDLDEALSRALAAGAALEQGPDARSWGRIAVLADPFGHGVCLVQFTGGGYDEIALRGP